MRAGEPVKMSKRSGDFVTLREVVDEVGADAVRFIMLMRKNDAPLDFDLAKVIEQSQDNPVFYVQYAHARARSVLRQALCRFSRFRHFAPQALARADFSLLDRRRRARPHARAGQLSPCRSPRPPKRTSLIASPSTLTIWRRSFTPIGIAAKIRHIYDTLTELMQI